MSDQSVADQGDQPDEQDQPDQGSAPPSPSSSFRPPPGAPSPLGSLVAKFMQMGQGRPMGPLPQPAVQAPFDQLQQRTMQREQPFARPTGAFPPYQSAPVQTYMPAQPIRPSSEWGTSGQFPNTPSTWELPGMWQGIGSKLSQIGSGNVAQIASMLGPYSGTLMKSYIAGQDARIKRDHELAVFNAWELDKRQTEELKQARDVFALFGGDITSMTGEDPNVSLPQVGKFYDAMMSVANRNNDTVLQSALQSGDMKRVENVLKERDASSKDLKASLAQQEKDQAKRDAEAPFRKDGGPSQAGPPIGHTDPAPGVTPSGALPTDTTPDPNAEAPAGGTQPPPGTPPEEATPEDTGSTPQNDISPYGPATPAGQARAQPPGGGVRVAQAGASDVPQPGVAEMQAQAPQPAQMSPVEQAADQAGWRTDLMNAAALQAVNDPMFKAGAKGNYPGYPVAETGFIMRRAQEIQGQLEQIKNSNLTGPAAEAAIRRVDPQLADALKQYVQGNLPVPQTARYGNLAAQWILPLGQKMDPSFNENNFRTRYQTKKDFTSGVDGRTLTSVATAKKHLTAALAAMDHVPNYLWSQIGNWRSLDMIVPPEVQQAIGVLDNSIHTGSNEYERALLGGKPSRGSITDTEAELDWRHKSPEYVKSLLQNKIVALKARLGQLEDQYQRGMGRGKDDMFKSFDNWATSGKDASMHDQGDPERTLASPEQLRDLRDLDGMPAGSVQAAPVPRDLSKSANPDADYNSLPSGTVFIGPDGQRRRKP